MKLRALLTFLLAAFLSPAFAQGPPAVVGPPAVASGPKAVVTKPEAKPPLTVEPKAAKPTGTKDESLPWFAAKITVERASGKMSSGSGTPVACENGKALILTNSHVVRRADKDEKLSVTLQGLTYQARYVDGAEVKDNGDSTIRIDGPGLALVEIDANIGWVSFRDTPLKADDAVYQWGYTYGADKPVAKSGKAEVGRAVGEITYRAGTDSGDSGAGLFDTNGNMVGVVCSIDRATGENYAVRLTIVEEFIEKPATTKMFPKMGERAAALKAKLKDVKDELAQPRAVAPRLFDPPVIPRSTCPNGNCPQTPWYYQSR